MNDKSPTKPLEIYGDPVIDIGIKPLCIKTWWLEETIMIALDGK